MKKIIATIILILIIAGGIIGWRFYANSKNKQIGPSVCTEEAKLCPDGSYVGRTEPACEFAPCPVITETQIPSDWKKFTDLNSKPQVSFQYPETLGTKYISTQEWPPKIDYSGNPIGSNCILDPTLKPNLSIEPKKINEKDYCIQSSSEGAAGTIYITYDYSFLLNNLLTNIHFVLRYPECGNYPEPQMTECNTERSSFNLDNLIGQIAQSIKMN